MESKQKQPLATLTLANGDELSITGQAKVSDLLAAQKAARTTAEVDMIMVAMKLRINGKSVDKEVLENLDVGVIAAAQEFVIGSQPVLTPCEDNGLGYPRKYQYSTGEIVSVISSRLVKHETKASQLSDGDVNKTPFFMLSFLLEINGERVSFDDWMAKPVGFVLPLLQLVAPKKYQFVGVSS